MTAYTASFARRLRLRRLFRHGDGRLLVVPLDHSITDGPICRGAQNGQNGAQNGQNGGLDGGLDGLVGELAGTGVDAVVLHKGSLRHVAPGRFAGMSLIVHLSASTRHAPDPNAKYLVAGVAEALRLGADAVSVHVNLGSEQEARQVADLAAVSEECDRWNVPLLAMMYARGPKIRDSRAPELVAHAASLAADLGADVVKTEYAGTPEGMTEVVRGCPIPVIAAGGPRRNGEHAVLAGISDVLRGGAAGVAVGRNVFQASQPRRMAAAIARLVHDAEHRAAQDGAIQAGATGDGASRDGVRRNGQDDRLALIN